MDRRWYKFLCRHNAYDKCVKVHQKVDYSGWIELQKRIVITDQFKRIEEKSEDCPWNMIIEFSGFARIQTQPSCGYHTENGVSGIPHRTRSYRGFKFNAERVKSLETYVSITRERRIESERIKYLQLKQKKHEEAIAIVREKSRMYAMKKRNQSAADQFFIMAGAAEQLTKLKPKQ